MSEEKKSFWTTLPGIITALATLITAIGGLLALLNQIGVIGSGKDQTGTKLEVAESSMTSGGNIVSNAGLQDVEKEELRRRQSELEKQIADMKRKMDSEESSTQSEPFGESVTYVVAIVQIAGLWEGEGEEDYLITQVGSDIGLQETNPLYGITAVGSGRIEGSQITLSITTALGTTGTARLEVSADKRTIAGQYHDMVAGVTVPLTLTRH